MNSDAFDHIYKDVPQEQKDELLHFRDTHTPRHLQVGSVNWEYIACGKGEQTLVILPGGLRSGEAAFRLILALEDEFRILAPTYPPLPRIRQWVEGVRAVMDAQGVAKAHVFGSSAGGMLGQCIVRQYPQRVERLILGDTSLPDRVRGEKYVRRSKLMPFLPVGLVRRMGKRSLPKMVAELPEELRPFWLAYLSELVDKIYTRDWLNASYQVGIDYMLNYTFHCEDLQDWAGQMLIIESDDDTVIGLEQLKLVRAMYPQAQVYTFHNAGHVPAITHEAEYVRVLRNFLKSGPNPEGLQDS